MMTDKNILAVLHTCMCHFAIRLTHYYKTAVFLHLFLFLFQPSTIISSFVLCSVYDTFIIRLHIHISNASRRRMSSFVESMFRFYSTQHSIQMLSPYASSSEGWGILAWGFFSCRKPLFPQQFSFLFHDNKKQDEIQDELPKQTVVLL